MQKVTGVFYSRSSFLNDENKNEGVAVRLTIDYLTGEYTITPQHDKDYFTFKKSSRHPYRRNYKMWKAVLKAIDNAIDFANKELEITEDDKKVWNDEDIFSPPPLQNTNHK